MHRTKSTDPADRLGVFKRFADVPEEHRLSQYADAYTGRDVWAEYCRAHLSDQGDSESFQRMVDRVGERWQAHMADRGVHHALARPADIETWCQELIDAHALATAYNYWVKLKGFYDWLQTHVAHPHVYHPVLLSVLEGGAAREIWDEKLRKWAASRAREASGDA